MAIKRDTANTLKQIQMDIEQAQPEAMTYEVKCPCCGGVFFETTDKYNANQSLNPTMIRLLPIYQSYGWAEVVHDASCGYGDMICPECESMLAPEGKLRLI